MQCLQNLVIFWGTALVKVNIAMSFWGSPFEWYFFELSDFDHNALNNDPGMKNWINTLFYCFKVPTSVALGLLTNEIYFFDNACSWRPPAQYVRTIIRHSIGCNIIDVANQLFFVYQGLAPELWVFVVPPIESKKISNFIHTLKKKQEMWHKMITALATSHKYYNPAQRPSPYSYRLPFPNQSKTFLRYQSQQPYITNFLQSSATTFLPNTT